MANEWTPCVLIDYGEDWDGPRYGLIFDEFGDSQDFLEEQGYMAGGYTWHAIVESLMRTDHKKHSKLIEYHPEGSTFVARSFDKGALKVVLQCIKSAIEDESVLRKALDNADQEILE